MISKLPAPLSGVKLLRNEMGPMLKKSGITV